MSNINKHYAEILREDFTTVAVKFNNSSQTYTYKIDRELVKSVKLGSTVLVPNCQKTDGAVYHSVDTMVEMAREMEVRVPIKSVIVVAIHDEPEIELEAEFQYKWVVDVVDFTKYHENNTKDQLIREAANKGRAINARAQLRQTLLTPELQKLLGNG